MTESHKSAYCWTAAECTVRSMWPLSVSEGLYSDAVERIWTKRVGGLKESESGLVSEELLKWEVDLNKALVDDEMYQRIRETNVRYSAVSFLIQLLEEQWALLGRSCSSLESVAKRLLLKGDGGGVRSREDPKGVVDEGEKGNGEDNRDVHGLEIDAAEEEEEEERLLLKRKKGDKGDGVVCSREDLNAVLESGVQRRLFLKGDGDGGVRSREDPNAVVDESTRRCLDEGEKENGDNHGVECLEIDEQHAATEEEEEEERRMGALEPDEPSLDKGDKVTAQELKDYLLEIQQQIDSFTRQLQEPNNANITPQPSRVNRTGTSGQQQDNASEEGWSSRVRPRLPTPVPLNVSPLKKKKANPSTRRQKKFWTPEEEAALREGVKENGKSWKYIKNANPTLFADRTEVDLKDKWRNLVR
ncbi:hypothetical protein N665_0118s0042 [Sinapis alba]|nr:hypothetical protein N665_0118s0042 [Sinapis alba]